jgi:phenylalanyl-tRNA synthetase beta chain
MKIIESWLREWVNPPLTVQQIAEQLTMAGLEVAEVQSLAAHFSGVVIGEVVAVEAHPNADRLRLCKVNINGGDTASLSSERQLLSIVCGASNVRPGLRVPVAVVGAVLPNNFIIKQAQLRGIDSCGMLCSAKELQLGDLDPATASKGLMELSEDAPIGMDLREYLKLNDNIIVLELTANRGDCLSMLGVAREVAVLNNLSLAKFNEIKKLEGKLHKSRSEQNLTANKITIHLTAPADCPSYTACLIKGINNKVATPAWIKTRLEQSGLRCVNPVVDVTNYVMLELGQPLHAFAYGKINGGITVRRAVADEQITLLDGTELTLTPDALLIADSVKALALAGVMGGQESAVDAETTDILLESAYFDPATIRKTAQRYNLQSDAAYRFERGVDPTLQSIALARARQLLLEIVDGVGSRSVNKCEHTHIPVAKPITIQLGRVERLLGKELSGREVGHILKSLAMEVEERAGKADHKELKVTAPPHRFDISIAEDVIEEVARVYGYDKLPATPVRAELLAASTLSTLSMLNTRDARGASAALDEHELDACEANRGKVQICARAMKKFLVGRGYSEAVTYSFISEHLQKLLDPRHAARALALVNPLSSEMAVMRTNLLAGLVGALQHNLSRKQQNISLFEIGLCFERVERSLPRQRLKVAGLLTGEAQPNHWDSHARRAIDFYDIKSDVECLLRAFHYNDEDFVFRAIVPDAEEHAEACVFHPKRCAAVYLNGILLGYVGELHPQIRQKLEIKQPVCLFQLDITIMSCKIQQRFTPISKFPAIERDLALVLSKEILWQQVKDQIKASAAEAELSELLQAVNIFDIYCGDKIEQGKQSIALRLRFQHLSRTLTDVEIDNLLQKIIKDLEKKFNAFLRE